MRNQWTMWAVLALIAVLISGAQAGAELITEGQWFSSIGHFDVFRTQLMVQLGMGLVGGVLALLVVGGSARLAARQARGAPRPSLVPDEANPLAAVLANMRATTVADGLSLVVAIATGFIAAGWWREGLLLAYGGDFGWQDPVWGLDASFYVFDLPMIQRIQTSLAGLIVVAGVLTVGLYIARGVVRLQMVQQDGQIVANGVVVPVEARRHVASLAAALLAVIAIGVYLSRYTLLHSEFGLITGPGYADLYGTLPLLTVQAVITAIAAFVVFVGLDRGSMGTLMLGVAMVVLSGGLTSVYPGLLEQFSVRPNQLSREGPQIVDHIEATRYAFELDAIEESSLSGQASLDRADIDANEATIKNVRLWDHKPLLETFSQVQEIRTYYGFVEVDNDRYEVDGELRQIMVSPRELTVNSLPEKAKTWVNETMAYTHGYGVALGPVNRVNEQGLPVLWVQDLPPKVQHTDAFEISRPEIYFGEVSSNEVVVNTDNPEFDYPVGNENEYTEYAGKDGVSMAGLNRLLFTLRYGEANLLFSGDIHKDSRILLHRNVVERARQVVPFVVFDRDPYMVISEGRLVWVLDAYTTTHRFPYAKQLRGIGNYLRNSVKVTVDAYDGEVIAWLSDESDPIAKSLGTGVPRPSEADRADAGRAPRPSALPHRPVHDPGQPVRHVPHGGPPDLLQPRRRVGGAGHPEPGDAALLHHHASSGRGSRGVHPHVAVLAEGQTQPRRMDGGPRRWREAWRSTHVQIPQGHLGLRAQDGGRPHQPGRRNLREDQPVGPARLRRHSGYVVGDSDRGIPHLHSAALPPGSEEGAEDSIPELKRVIVAYEDDIAMTPTLEEGLDALFGLPSDAAAAIAPPSDPSAAPDSDPAPASAPELSGSVMERIREAAVRYDAANRAVQSGDWSQFGEELEALGVLLESLDEDASAADVK